MLRKIKRRTNRKTKVLRIIFNFSRISKDLTLDSRKTSSPVFEMKRNISEKKLLKNIRPENLHDFAHMLFKPIYSL